MWELMVHVNVISRAIRIEVYLMVAENISNNSIN
jgi:hypothetical protein